MDLPWKKIKTNEKAKKKHFYYRKSVTAKTINNMYVKNIRNLECECYARNKNNKYRYVLVGPYHIDIIKFLNSI